MNPYRQVRDKMRRRQGGRGRWLVPLVAIALATPLLRPTLLGFLDVALGEGSMLASGVEGIAFRLGCLVAGAMALHTYSDLVRSPERAVLDPHPVLARPLLAAIALDTARDRLYLPLGSAIVLLPIATAGHVVAWLGACGVVLAAWLCSLGVGYTVHLAAVWSAWSPSLARLLDLLRGDNPRLQAALIYAPGVALIVVGTAVAFASAGLRLALLGWTPGWALLGLPLVVGLAGWALVGPLADRWYVRATSLLAEIDAMYAGQEDEDGERHVYLDWLARDRPELLRALRQGWRRLRLWPMGAWGLGFIGLIAAWTDSADAGLRALAVAGAGVVLVSAVPVRLAEGDPAWLDDALGVDVFGVLRARWIVGFCYAQGVVLPTIAALGLRHGTIALPVFAVLELMAFVGAGLAAAGAARWRGRALLAYGPGALLAWAVVVWIGSNAGLLP